MWSTVGLIGSSLATAAAVVIAARRLGTASYGVYAGIGALVNLAAMFGAMGTKDLLLQRVSRDRAALPGAWGVLLAANVVAGVPLLTVTVGLAAALLPGRDLLAIVAIATAEYVSAGLVKGPANAWVALDRFPVVAAVNILDAGLRLAAAATLLVGPAGVRQLATALLVAMAVGAVVVNVGLLTVAGRPTVSWSELLDGCRRGAAFSVSAVSGAVQSNIDQFMLVRARLDVDAGLYAAGVRFMAYSMLPLHALVSAAVPEFHRLGAQGLDAGLAYGRRLVRPVVAISLAGAAVAVALSPPLGALFGDRFGGVLPVVAALSLFPLVRTLQVLVGTALQGSGHQGFVARCQFATAGFNVALNVPLIARYGWRGAVAATYASELTNLALLWHGRRHRRSVPGMRRRRVADGPVADGPVVDGPVGDGPVAGP
jgi:O-antigen/teichoic acid export membrane protein